MSWFHTLFGWETPEARKIRERDELRKKNEEYLRSDEYRHNTEKLRDFADKYNLTEASFRSDRPSDQDINAFLRSLLVAQGSKAPDSALDELAQRDLRPRFDKFLERYNDFAKAKAEFHRAYLGR